MEEDGMSIGAITFKGDDKIYLTWLQDNPDGYVINTPRGLSPSYMVLHRATCRTIRPDERHYAPGAFTERQYVKVCSADLTALQHWVTAHGRPDGSFSSTACRCHPLG
jgi:hypothetical protein